MTKTISAADYVATVQEHSLQVTVLQYLELRARGDVYWFAIPNSGKRGPHAAQMMKEEGLRAGVADLCIMLSGGRVAWLELKTLKGVQRQDQKAFELICETLEHPYCLARTFEAAINFLKEIGALR